MVDDDGDDDDNDEDDDDNDDDDDDDYNDCTLFNCLSTINGQAER